MFGDLRHPPWLPAMAIVTATMVRAAIRSAWAAFQRPGGPHSLRRLMACCAVHMANAVSEAYST